MGSRLESGRNYPTLGLNPRGHMTSMLLVKAKTSIDRSVVQFSIIESCKRIGETFKRLEKRRRKKKYNLWK